MLRARVIQDINNIIAESNYFNVGDFRIDMNRAEASDYTELQIKYRYDEAYYFRVEVPAQRSAVGNTLRFVIAGSVSPGELSAQEPITLHDFTGLKKGLSDWLKRVRTEIGAAPVFRRLAEQEAKLEEFRSQLSRLPDEYFSAEEAEHLRERLDELEQRLTDNLEQLVTDKAELAAKVQAVTMDFEMLKDSVNSATKPNWAAALGARVFNWVKDPVNRKLLASGAEVAKELLLEAGHKSASAGK